MVYLAARDVPAQLVSRLKLKLPAKKLAAVGEVVALQCEIESRDGHYLHIKVHHPIEANPELTASVFIPHTAIIMIIESDQQAVFNAVGGST